MINFHRPETWQDPAFTLRAPGTTPPSGDFCLVWEGTESDLRALLERVGARIEEGPVERRGARRAMASSIYVRDPDGNLLEFMRYLGV
jgi:catechol 2,3-dioxygenase-like lactoylglutathione lyase family enzyme